MNERKQPYSMASKRLFPTILTALIALANVALAQEPASTTSACDCGVNLWETFVEESVKTIPKVGLAVLTLALGWLVGNRISSFWSLRQKRKESDLAAAQDFHSLYGEFFAVWKVWNYFKKKEGKGCADDAQWRLLDRACRAEGKMEALFVRLASERRLAPKEIETLGKFRQAFQQLRESIRGNRPIDWRSSHHKEYKAFKELAAGTAQIILAKDMLKLLTTEDSAKQLKDITDNKWEDTWTENLE